MAQRSVFDMSFSKIYSALVQKVVRKGRTKEDVYEVTSWLTGYTSEQIDSLMESDITYGKFFSDAPSYNPHADLITGKVCGIQVETMEKILHRGK